MPVVAACAGAPTDPSTASPTALPPPASTSPGDTSPPASPTPTPRPTPDPLVPVALPIREFIALDGTVVLGLDASYLPVLYDLVDHTLQPVLAGPDPMLGALSERVLVGAVLSTNGKRNLPFALDRATGSPVDLDLGRVREGWAHAADGPLVVGSVIGADAVFVHDLDTGRTRRLDFLDGEDRIGIAALDGSRMAGTFGMWDAEQAWAYDLETGLEIDLHGLLGGSNSWAHDVDGDLVVGAVETPRTWEHRAFVYDVVSGSVIDLAQALGGYGDAMGVDGALVVGTLREEDRGRAFVHDLDGGLTTFLPGLPQPGVDPSRISTGALAIEGRFVVGWSGKTIVAWDLSALP